MAGISSSNAFPTQKKYDVFISFRGEDTRRSFTSHLHAALCQKKIGTFIDERDLEKGDEISPMLAKAIEDSKISVIIFSKDYASSSWCLGELNHILLCKKNHKQIVIPVFYDVDPSDIRHQRGSYADAFAKHEERFKGKIEKLQKWRRALTTVAGFSGLDSSVTGSDHNLVEAIVKDIVKKLGRTSAGYALKGLVGIEKRIEKIESLLNISSSDVRIISLWGTGGIGKSTLAKAVFNRIAHEFEGRCFLQNVREESKRLGLIYLQTKLFSKLLGEESVDIENPFVKDRLGRTKVLIVLDDVDDVDQLEHLAGDHEWFCPGSRIIITSRDLEVLNYIEVDERYDVEELNFDEALQLFHSKAFQENSSRMDYVKLAERAVSYAQGIPLVLRILGSHLRSKNQKEWESELNKITEVPDKKVYDVFRTSYDGLDENAKHIILDISYFFKGEDVDFAKGILVANGLFVDTGVRALMDKSLLTITQNKFWMHDLLQQMGIETVRQESEEPGNRSRLCSTKDVSHVLRYNTGTPKIRGMSMNMSELEDDICLDPLVFKKMYNLKLLKFIRPLGCSYKLNLHQDLETLPSELRYLCWDHFPLKSLPSDFTVQNLVELHLRNSQLQHFWGGIQHFRSLKVLNLEGSKNLTQIPDLSQALRLEKIKLKNCESLENIPRSISKLEWLQSLDLSGCLNIDRFPELPRNIKYLNMSGTSIKQVHPTTKHLSHLEIFDLSGCSRINKFPDLPRNLKHLNIGRTKIEEVPPTIQHLSHLERFDFSGCSRIDKFPELPKNIKHLIMSGTKIEQVPPTVKHLLLLETFDLSDCSKICKFPELPQNVKHLIMSRTMVEQVPPIIKHLSHLETFDLSGCSKIDECPELPRSLKHLKMSGTKMKLLRSKIMDLSHLETLELFECKSLTSLPTLKFRSGHRLKPPRSLSIQFLHLMEISLENTSIRKIPGRVFSLPFLTSLNISRTAITAVPASIKDSKLRLLAIRGCKSLQSLPELPVSITFVNAKGCTSLEKVTTSSVPLAPKVSFWDNNYERLIFDDCIKLDCGNIMDEFRSRAVRKAIGLTKDIRVQRAPEPPRVIISFPGNVIPKWFSHQNEGCLVHVKLPPHWYDTNFTGFAACLVLARDNHGDSTRNAMFWLQCEMSAKTINDETCFNHASAFNGVGNHPHVFLWYFNGNVDSSAVELSFRFSAVYEMYGSKSSFEVKRCGIRMLHLQDVAGLGFLGGESNVATKQLEPRINNLNISEPLPKRRKL